MLLKFKLTIPAVGPTFGIPGCNSSINSIIYFFKQFINKIDTKQAVIIPTILLLKSAGMARYIDRNIRNISIPSETIKEIQKSPDKQKKCIQIAADIIVKMKELGTAGVMISTVGWEDKLPRILDEAKL